MKTVLIASLVIFNMLCVSANSQTWEQSNGPYGGDIRSFAINSSGDIFIGAYYGGVFRSTDNGDNWTQINNGLTNTVVTCIAVNSSGDIFAGTWGSEGGIFRSIDNGNNWVEIMTDGAESIAINSSGDIFAGTYGGVFRSTDNGDNWTQTGLTTAYVFAIAINSSGDIFAGTYKTGAYNSGVFRSTDNGDTWTRINTDLTDNSVYAIAINSSGDIFTGTDVGVFRSTDNGDSWTEINTALTDIFVYAIAINSSGGIFAGTNRNGVFRSTDNGDSWTEINDGLTDFTSVFAITISSSGDIFAGTIGGGVFRSTDNGDAWVEINTGLTSTWVRAIAINSSRGIFAGLYYGGVFRSTDNGDSWTQINNGLTYKKVFAIAINSSGDIFASTSGRDGHFSVTGVFRSTDNGDSWTEIGGLKNAGVGVMAINSSGDVFAAAGSRGFFRSTDNGDSWTEISGPTDAGVGLFVINSSDDILAAISGLGLFRSTDNGDSWTQINNGLTYVKHVDAIAINSSGDIFAGTSNYPNGGGLFRSTDNGDNWTEMSTGHYQTYVQAMAINSSDDIFAVIGHYGVFRSTDNGDTWAEINDGLTNTTVRTLAANAAGDMFAGTSSNGVFLLPASGIQFQFPVDDYMSSLSSCFGWELPRTNPETHITKWHVGEDVRCHDAGTAIVAVADGVVKYARWRGTVCDNWGPVVVIEHTLPDNSKVCSIYGHIDIFVSEGDVVLGGDEIGTIGAFLCDDFVWTDHLHFGIYDGEYGPSAGEYPEWLTGYLMPDDFPGRYLKPSDFIEGESASSLTITLACPASMLLVTPSWDSVSIDYNTSDDIDYLTWNHIFGQDSIDQIVITDPSLEKYRLFIIPDSGATDTSTYSLYSSYENNVAVLAYDAILGDVPDSGYVVSIDITTDVGEDNDRELLPKQYVLAQNYPNPFNPETRIEFSLPRTSHVIIDIYNILGRRVRMLVDESLSPGNKVVRWDGKDENGAAVSSGIYLYRITAGEFVASKKMLLIK